MCWLHWRLDLWVFFYDRVLKTMADCSSCLQCVRDAQDLFMKNASYSFFLTFSTFFKTNFYWSIVSLQCCVSFYYSKMSQLCIHVCPHPLNSSPSRSPLSIGSRALCCTEVLIGHLFYTQYQWCIYISIPVSPFFHPPTTNYY